MTPRQTAKTQRRDTWHETKNGTPTLVLGKRGGVVVRLFENRKSGYYYADVHRPGVPRERKTLGTQVRAEADRLGRELWAQAFLGVDPATKPGRSSRDAAKRAEPTLGQLCDRFLNECPNVLDKPRARRRETQTRLAVVRSALGENHDASRLTHHDAQRYEQRRRAGGIPYGVAPDGRALVTRPVRQRAAQADLKLLKQVLNWASTELGADGEPLLSLNRLKTYKTREETDVRRPVATRDRFLATRAAIRTLQRRYEDEAVASGKKARRRAESRGLAWVRAELALILFDATGRRRGSVAKLRWSDIDFERSRITWRGEYDKKRKSWVTVYPAELFDELRSFQKRLPSSGGFLFPREDGTGPTKPELLSQWMVKAEREAGLPKLEGSLIHAYRRKWKSERAHVPLAAVAAGGGWRDIATMMKYDIPDDDAILAATSSPRHRWSSAAERNKWAGSDAQTADEALAAS